MLPAGVLQPREAVPGIRCLPMGFALLLIGALLGLASAQHEMQHRRKPRQLKVSSTTFLVTVREGGTAERAVTGLNARARERAGRKRQSASSDTSDSDAELEASFFGEGRVGKVHMTAAQAHELLMSDADVVAVEPDTQVWGMETEWHLDRVDQPTLPLDTRTFQTGGQTGLGTRVYVIDTGVYGAHNEFKDANGASRVEAGASFLHDADPVPPANSQICQSHGTHCASLVGGLLYGVAKEATIVPVRVLDCFGSGWTSDIISGMAWAIEDAEQHPGTRAVFSVSLGSEKNAASNYAVAQAVRRGIPVIVAAASVAAWPNTAPLLRPRK